MSLELAAACLQAGELADALDALAAHLAQFPDDQAARHLRSDVLLRLPGRARDALAELDQLRDDDPLLRYQILELIGDHEAAFAAVSAGWEQGRDLRLAELYLRLLRERREFAAALRLLADLPKTWRWLSWSGDFHALKGDFCVAAQQFCSALDELQRLPNSALTDAERAHLLLKRADTYRRLKRWPEAEADLQAAARIIPNDPTILFNQGLVLYESGDLYGALPLCRDALDHAPDALRDTMRATLTTEPRYQTLAQALLR